MIIETIDAISIFKELPTEGHSPLLVLGSDYEMYVAKNDKGKEPPFALINEFLSSYLLSKWNIKSPEVKLISIERELILAEENLSINHRPYFYNIPCFGSKFVNNAIDLNAFLITHRRKAYNKLNNPIDVFHITLFDTWIENDDRKPTNYNLILEPFEGKFNVLPIDHAFIFSSLSYQDINPEFVSVSVNDHLLISDLGYLVKANTSIDINFINNERDYFYLCIERCQQNFDDFMYQLAGIYKLDLDLVKNLKEFLFNVERNNKVFAEYVDRLHQ